MNTYSGRRLSDGTAVVYTNGKVLSPARSLRVWNHSPTGFEWGYGGSGPAQLGLALLLEETDREEAVRLHQEFKWDVIAPLRQEGTWVIDSVCIEDWLEKNRSAARGPSRSAVDGNPAAAGAVSGLPPAAPAGGSTDNQGCLYVQA